MGKLRHSVFPSEGTVKQHMEGSTGQPFFTTDDVGDFHQMIIHDVGQVIGGQFIGTLVQHLVIENLTLYDDFPTDQVLNVNFLTWINLEADHILLSFADQGINFLLRQRQGVAHHATCTGIILEILDFIALGLQLLRGVESNVSLTGCQEFLYIFLIDITTLTLAIGTILATKTHALVELDTQPLERFDDIFLSTGHETVRVGILNTEHKVTPVLTGKQIIIQCCTYTSYVQSTRRTGCKTHSNSSF